MKRGEIYWANLDPTIGSEISKTRPVLLVSNDINNEVSETVTVLPITSQTGKVYPYEVILSSKEINLPTDSKVKANQIRTISKRRIGNNIGAISSITMSAVEKAIAIHLDLK